MGEGEAGGQHVAVGEEMFVSEDVLVVVVEEEARSALDVEEPPGARGAEDALRLAPPQRGLELAVSDAALTWAGAAWSVDTACSPGHKPSILPQMSVYRPSVAPPPKAASGATSNAW